MDHQLLIDISATMHTCKQSLKAFVLWLCNQHYYTCDIIGIKMTYRDLPYYGPKNAVRINFMKISMKIMQTLYIPLENGP